MHDQSACAIRWRCRDRELDIGRRTLIMGVLNATPDSFYDGGRHSTPELAVDRGIELAETGADIIDVGGESTRPGSSRVSVEEEIRRVIPVIRSLISMTQALISVDTMKAEVARRSLEEGAHIINDVSALTFDQDMPGIAVKSGAGVILMHMQGEPGTMQDNPSYDDVTAEVGAYLDQRINLLSSAGLPLECIAVDPGIGFGKTVDHNLQLLRDLDSLNSFSRPVVVGFSRKSFLGRITGQGPGDLLPASLGAAAVALMRGAHIIRTHDVKETCDVARLVDTIRLKESGHDDS